MLAMDGHLVYIVDRKIGTHTCYLGINLIFYKEKCKNYKSPKAMRLHNTILKL